MAANRERVLKQFGQSVAQRRHALGLSQEQLAHKSGLHPNYVGDLERGERNPTLITLLALARGLGCSISQLLKTPFP